MGLHIQMVRRVAEMVTAIEGSPSQWQKLRALLNLLEQLKTLGPTQAPNLVLSEYTGHTIKGRDGQKCWESYQKDEPEYAQWRVRWYFSADETILIFDIDQRPSDSPDE